MGIVGFEPGTAVTSVWRTVNVTLFCLNIFVLFCRSHCQLHDQQAGLADNHSHRQVSKGKKPEKHKTLSLVVGTEG